MKEVAEDRLGFYVSRRLGEQGWKSVEQLGVGSLAPGKDGLPRYFSKFLRQSGIERPFILSDSFETLRAAASAGALVAVLPNRIALRLGDLAEITPPRSGKALQETGKHRISVVSLANCDPAETDFLAAEAGRFFHA